MRNTKIKTVMFAVTGGLLCSFALAVQANKMYKYSDCQSVDDSGSVSCTQNYHKACLKGDKLKKSDINKQAREWCANEAKKCSGAVFKKLVDAHSRSVEYGSHVVACGLYNNSLHSVVHCWYDPAGN